MGNFSEDINSKFSNYRLKALLNILYTANWINSKQNAAFKPFKVSPQQYNILKIVNGSIIPLKVQTIKDRMVERSPNATRLMDKLCKKNLIKRVACPGDRRVVHIKITEDGTKLLQQIAEQLEFNILLNLTEAEAKKLSNLLDKIR